MACTRYQAALGNGCLWLMSEPHKRACFLEISRKVRGLNPAGFQQQEREGVRGVEVGSGCHQHAGANLLDREARECADGRRGGMRAQATFRVELQQLNVGVSASGGFVLFNSPSVVGMLWV